MKSEDNVAINSRGEHKDCGLVSAAGRGGAAAAASGVRRSSTGRKQNMELL